MNRTDVLVIACFGALFIAVLLCPVIPMALKNTMSMKVYAQQQQQQDKLDIIMKIGTIIFMYSLNPLFWLVNSS